MPLQQVPTQNNLQYTLDSQIAAGASSLTLNQSVAGVVQAPGVLVIDRVDSSGNTTPSKREFKKFTGVSGAQITGLQGGLAGSTDQVHAVGAIVEFVPDVLWAQSVYDAIIQEHTVNGQHASLASVTHVRSGNIIGLSLASLNRTEMNNLNVSSLASINELQIKTLISASGASVVGFPSGSGTGGLNAVFQVPGGLSSLSNVGGMIPIPTAFTASFLEAYVQTPASVASISVMLKKNLNTTIGMVTILAGATYGSSASIASAALTATDNLTIDINSTASLATDLSVVLRAT